MVRQQIQKRGEGGVAAPLTTLDLVSENLDYIHTTKFVSKYYNLNCFKYKVLDIQMYNVHNSA